MGKFVTKVLGSNPDAIARSERMSPLCATTSNERTVKHHSRRVGRARRHSEQRREELRTMGVSGDWGRPEIVGGWAKRRS